MAVCRRLQRDAAGGDCGVQKGNGYSESYESGEYRHVQPPCFTLELDQGNSAQLDKAVKKRNELRDYRSQCRA
jgi:hypothetical protein